MTGPCLPDDGLGNNFSFLRKGHEVNGRFSLMVWYPGNLPVCGVHTGIGEKDSDLAGSNRDFHCH